MILTTVKNGTNLLKSLLVSSQAAKVKIDDKNGCNTSKFKTVSFFELPEKPAPNTRDNVCQNSSHEIMVVITDVVIRYFIV
jgi:hypothetical protein